MNTIILGFFGLLAAYLLFTAFRLYRGEQPRLAAGGMLLALGLAGFGWGQYGGGPLTLNMAAGPGELSDLKGKFDELMKQKVATEAEVTKVAEERKTLQVQLETLKVDLTKAKEVLMGKASEADAGKAAEPAKAETKVAQAAAPAPDAEVKLAAAMSAQAAAELGQKSLQSQVSALRDSLSRTNSALMARLGAARETEAEVTRLRADLVAANDKANAPANCDAVKAEASAGQASLQGQVGALRGSLTQSNNALMAKFGELRACNAQVAEANAANAATKSAMQAQIGTLVAALSSSNSALLKQKVALVEVESESSTNSDAAADLKANLNLANVRIEQFEAQVAKLEADLQASEVANVVTYNQIEQGLGLVRSRANGTKCGIAVAPKLSVSGSSAPDRIKREIVAIADMTCTPPAAPAPDTAELDKVKAELKSADDTLAKLRADLDTSRQATEAAELRVAEIGRQNIVTYNQIEQGLGLVRSRASSTKCGISFNPKVSASGQEASDRIKRELALLSDVTCTPPVPEPAPAPVVEAPKAPDPLLEIKDRLSRPYSTDYYGVKVHENAELVEGQKGAYYVIDIKNAVTKADYRFDGGGYIMTQGLAEYDTSVKKLVDDVLGKLDGKKPYVMYVRGKADAQRMRVQRVMPEGSDYAQIAYLPLAPAGGKGAYLNTLAGQDISNKVIENKHLPNLRAAYLSNLINKAKPDQRPEILEGVVTPKLDPNDRNAEVVLYVNWD